MTAHVPAAARGRRGTIDVTSEDWSTGCGPCCLTWYESPGQPTKGEEDSRKRRRHTPSRSSASCEKPTGCWPRPRDPEMAKQLEVSEATYHRWRTQYGGLKADDVRGLKELEPA